MTSKQILVAVNTLDGRNAAFERALAIARSSGADLYLLHAVSVKERYSFRAVDRLARMAEMRRRAEDAGVRVQTIEQHGDPADIIELHANARGVDLVVIGSEAGRGWRSRSAVVEKVIRRTDVPTLVVAGDVPDSPSAYRNVLVALDLSPDSKDVLRSAIELMAPQAVQLTVMHTVTGIEASDAVQSPARWKVPEFRAHALEDARQRLNTLVADMPLAVEPRMHVSSGSAARTVLDHAADIDADLVVMGRSRGFKLLGSTALRVLRKNDRSLLVIPGAASRIKGLQSQAAA